MAADCQQVAKSILEYLVHASTFGHPVLYFSLTILARDISTSSEHALGIGLGGLPEPNAGGRYVMVMVDDSTTTSHVLRGV